MTIKEMSTDLLANYAKHAVASLERETNNRSDAAHRMGKPLLARHIKDKDTHDFNRAERKMSNRVQNISKAMHKLAGMEEETLDELSKKTIVSYGDKAAPDLEKQDADAAKASHDIEKNSLWVPKRQVKRYFKATHAATNRYHGLQTAINKLSGSARVPATEEVEMDDKEKLNDLVIASVMQEPLAFAQTFDDVLKGVISKKIDEFKDVIGKAMFNGEEPPPVEEGVITEKNKAVKKATKAVVKLFKSKAPSEKELSREYKRGYQSDLHEKTDWFLYSDHEKHDQAKTALDSAWEHAKTLGSAQRALAHMQKVQKEYKKVGATDSEPNAVVDYKISKHFKTPIDPVSKWRIGLLKGK